MVSVSSNPAPCPPLSFITTSTSAANTGCITVESPWTDGIFLRGCFFIFDRTSAGGNSRSKSVMSSLGWGDFPLLLVAPGLIPRSSDPPLFLGNVPNFPPGLPTVVTDDNDGWGSVSPCVRRRNFFRASFIEILCCCRRVRRCPLPPANPSAPPILSSSSSCLSLSSSSCVARENQRAVALQRRQLLVVSWWSAYECFEPQGSSNIWTKSFFSEVYSSMCVPSFICDGVCVYVCVCECVCVGACVCVS